jgi:hypothetical protein
MRGEKPMTALRSTAFSVAALMLTGTIAFELGLGAHRASGEAAPGAALSAAESPAPATRPWALEGFRDQESWRETSPSPDANQGR